jgi:hypothetical protein
MRDENRSLSARDIELQDDVERSTRVLAVVKSRFAARIAQSPRSNCDAYGHGQTINDG